MSTGRITLPAEAGQEAVVRDLIDRWGADALRDSDGTTLSPELADFGLNIYSTICIVRADQDYPRRHPTHLPQQYLMTPRLSGPGGELRFPDLLENFYKPKYAVNKDDDPKQWWQVFNRTNGDEVPSTDWDYTNGGVTVRNTLPWHEYTVNFLAYQTWDSTSMYNHLTNHWNREKVISVNPFIPRVYDHLMRLFDLWLQSHQHTDVVRFTTFAYMFMLVSDTEAVNSVRDWTGYAESVSPMALRAFEKEFGYQLTSEDFVDSGYFNITYRPPKSRYLDWIDFVNRFVTRFAKDLCDRAHAAGKRTAMFWGDHWIGVEPYRERFAEVGIDIHIGAAEDGTALRRITDAPGEQVKELRLYPYFFKDVFREGNDPTVESKANWRKIRMALLRKPTIDRLGWGGYLSLASRLPDFVDHLAVLSDQFRAIVDRTQQCEPWRAPVHVAVLNGWGQMRSWINQVGPAEKFYAGREDVMAFVGSNLTECLAALPVDVSFISFRDVLDRPALLDAFDVVINEGFAGTAWSGGDVWADPALTGALRAWVASGGGFIGIGEPTAYQVRGRFFQLADVLGVDKETGQSIQVNGIPGRSSDTHFITADELGHAFQPLNPDSYAFCISHNTDVLETRNRHVHIAARHFHAGRSVYLSALTWSAAHAQLLYRAILWVARQEACAWRCYATNPYIAYYYYHDQHLYALANGSDRPQSSVLYDVDGRIRNTELGPDELVFKSVCE